MTRSFTARERLLWLIVFGAVSISVTTAIVHGPRIVRELSQRKVVGDGDSLMAGSPALQLFEEALEQETGHEWFSELRAVGGSRVSKEVMESQRNRWFAWRLPWKNEDIVWMIGGTNDFGLYPKGERVEILLQAVEEYFRLQNDAGYDPSSCFYTDLLPRETLDDEDFDTDRKRFNSLVPTRLKGLAQVIPSGSNPALADPKDLRFFYDGLHLTAQGSEMLGSDAMKVFRERDRADH